MDLRFDGKTVIVTGGGSGIGAATAEELASSGATVVVADLNLEHAEQVVKVITDKGGKAYPFAVDVAKADQVKAMVDFAVAKTGALYGIVNNAGIGGPAAPTGSYDLEGWQKVIDINLSGVFYGMRFAIPEIEKAGGGAVVNVASILGSVGFANSTAYVSAKHAVVGATKNAALEHAAGGVRVNSVGPGFIHTPLVANALDGATLKFLEGKHALNRLGRSEEVAALIVFLLSERASFITGSYHLVDGGYTSQ
jgi:NAD(P)-dependent dehydrogenase (short-subunit alcohol dehydrogenase family)